MSKFLFVVSNAEEFASAKKFFSEQAGKNCRAVFIFHVFYPDSGNPAGNEEFKNKLGFVSKKELEAIEEEAGFFARNWYLFDREFEKAITYRGINLGFLHENEASLFFREIFTLVKAIGNAVEWENPGKIIAFSGSLAGECCAAVSKNREIVFLGAESAKRPEFPNLTAKKAREISRKLPKIIAELLGSGKGKGAETVFIRSRGYIGNVQKALEKDSSLKVVSLDEFLLKTLLNPFKLAEFVSKRGGLEKKFLAAFENYEKSPAFEKKFFFEGTDFRKLFEIRFRGAVQRNWPEFGCLIDFLSGVFDSEKPKITVLWEDITPFERICVLLARQRGTKSIVMQHGVFNPVLKKGCWISGFAPVTADRIAVWGPRFEKSLSGHGVPREKIVVTGPPRFDKLKKNVFNPAGFREKHGIKPEEKIITIITHATFNNEDFKVIIEEAENYGGKKKIIVKLHPLENPSKYNNAAAGRALIMQHTDLHELLNATDAVIMQNSTAGLEAMILGKPVIVFETKLRLAGSFNETGAVLRAKTRQELRKAIETALDTEKKALLGRKIREFVFDNAFEQDGKATERAVRAIKELMHE
ncbi:MAG: CDP-glycerol glycerophosphotransferase family protein [Candidatus ainarchaeum sp.]|nr:CDP-glycerol glycerophosphotransferase family protein [Candidatus ainarchaeum sp.]